MKVLGQGLSWIGPALFLLGTSIALLCNIQFGAIVMGVAIIFQVGADAIKRGWRRPVAVVAPLIKQLPSSFHVPRSKARDGNSRSTCAGRMGSRCEG